MKRKTSLFMVIMIASLCLAQSSVYAATKVTKIVIKQGKTATIQAGKTKQLTFTLTPKTAKVSDLSLSSNNRAVATVDSKGLVVGIKKGTATITAQARTGTAKATIKFTITAPTVPPTPKPSPTPPHVKSISLEMQIQAGNSFTLKAIASPPDIPHQIVWTSSDETIASVSSSGQVNALKAGNVTITAVALESNQNSFAKQEFKIEITPAPVIPPSKPALSISVKNKVSVGKILKLKANKPVSWKSSNKSIATVNYYGRVKGKRPGTVTITATTRSLPKEKKKVSVQVVRKK